MPVAIGCMRLSTEPDRDDERSVAVLHAAFDAGVTFLDTADAYCWNESETGHNERLIAHALQTWSGDRTRITVATKGGITRPEGRWQPDGRAKHLAAACERSCRALGVNAIDLYQLHVVDPGTPLATSVRALAALKRDGLIKSIGLCNVTVGQIEEARRIADVEAIQNELSVWHDGGILSGVAEYCVRNRIRFLAYRPLGGRKSQPRTQSDPALNDVASRHEVTPFEVALAWLVDLADVIVPIPGVTRIGTARSAAGAHRIRLTDADRRVLDAQFTHGRTFRSRTAPQPSPALRPDAEVVLVMGLPGAGKSTLTERFVAGGFQRLNRDESGGTLRDLLAELRRSLSAEKPRIVLDNTYVTRQSRAAVIQVAAELGVPIRCVWLATTVEDAQVNAVTRLITRYGKLPDESELAVLRKTDVAAFPPTVLFRYQRELEPPEASEGFSRIDVMPFDRHRDPAHVNRAVIVWCDDAAGLESHAPALRTYQEEGWQLCALSWQPSIAAGKNTHAEVRTMFAAAIERAGLSIDLDICPHGAGPPRCWCRKPLPGLGVQLIHRHQLNPERCLFVGSGSQDAGFARKLGFTHVTSLAVEPDRAL
jgi:aryl-alcohol dehydrogenase-like predicted oxidoreductase/predicted kinase